MARGPYETVNGSVLLLAIRRTPRFFRGQLGDENREGFGSLTLFSAWFWGCPVPRTEPDMR